ncbi:MAG TPA: choice-of-anchor V domain-containing protein [Pyrinomonadaceae bacterium]|nr:choice-of-anchor V domain-containing protein [Pyrinomonadaceae bacterium]
MTRRSRWNKAAKLSAIFAVSLVAVFGLTNASSDNLKVAASAGGPSPSHTNAPGEANCTACHSDFPVNSGTGNVTISGIPANYRPNQAIPVTVRTNQADAVVFGFQLTVLDSRGQKVGTFTLPSQMPAKTQLVFGLVNNVQRDYVEHTVDGIIPAQFGFNTWTFTWTAPSRRVGKVSFYAAGNAANSDGGTSGDYIYTKSAATLSGSATSNFDPDVRSDIAVYRPSSGVWYSLNSTDAGFQAVQFGIAEDKITPGDYDGDGKTDRAVWRPSTGVWYIQLSGGGVTISPFGSTGDIPVPGDYDGDLKTDIAVFRPSTGVWYIARSSDGTYDIRQFGVATDKVAQGDFDADGKTDLAVWRPSTGVWYIWRSTDFGFTIQGFGLNGDIPVQGDYDGDGKTDVAVFRPSNSVWYVDRSTLGFSANQFGISTDKPVPADFDGDGKTDIAVFRDGVWYILRSTDGGATISSFGLAGDVPIPTGYISQ